MTLKQPLLLGAFALVLSGALLLPGSLQAAPPVAARNFEIDAAHSSILFRVTHLGVSAFHGRFNQIKGTIVWADDDLANSSIELEIPVGSVDSNNEGRDKHLKGPDFFNATQFPVMGFKSSAIKREGEGYAISGTLSLHGVEKQITVQAIKVGEGDRGPRFGYRAGWETVFTLKRSDYGMSWGVDNKALGDEVRITIALEGLRK